MLRRGLGFLVPCCSPCRTMLRGGEGRSTDVSHGGAAHRRRMAGRWQGTYENQPSPPSAKCPTRRPMGSPREDQPGGGGFGDVVPNTPIRRDEPSAALV